MLPYWASLILALTIFCSSYLFAAKTAAPPLMHSHLYKSQGSISLYLVSEKLDGVRAYWDGVQFLTRKGNIIAAPSWFSEGFPDFPLDGELWMGRGEFDRLSGIVRSKTPIDADWQKVSYQVFDLPNENLGFSYRYQKLKSVKATYGNRPWLQVVTQRSFSTEESFEDYFQQTVDDGGEGLMLHDTSSTYTATRSQNLLKYKPVFDSEATVIGYTKGAGKYAGYMGALLVKTADGRAFKIGSGFTDDVRENPPEIGSLITFEYSGVTSTGLPRFARFKRIYNP